MARRIGGETILVPVVDNLADLLRIFVLNPVAEYIWENLGAPATLDSLSNGMAEEFDVSQEQARADCGAFLKELSEAGLLEAR